MRSRHPWRQHPIRHHLLRLHLLYEVHAIFLDIDSRRHRDWATQFFIRLDLWPHLKRCLPYLGVCRRVLCEQRRGRPRSTTHPFPRVSLQHLQSPVGCRLTFWCRSKIDGKWSSGLLPVLKLIDAAVMVVDPGNPKSAGGVNVYVEVWHADLLNLLNIRRMNTPESKSARGIYHGVVVPDLL